MRAPAFAEAGAFSGFTPDGMRFFAELADNQNKEWMAENKARYERSIRAPLAALVVVLSQRFEAEGIPFRGDPKRSLFRLNRDVRFSADKRPYNDHASAALTRNADRTSPGVLYIQLAPSASFVAAGFFRPEPEVLHSLRQGLAADPKGWAKMIAGLDSSGLALRRDDTLVRAPKGFEDATGNNTDDLKLKSWTVTRPLPKADISSAALVDVMAAFGQHSLGLLKFGWTALTNFHSSSEH